MSYEKHVGAARNHVKYVSKEIAFPPRFALIGWFVVAVVASYG